MEDRQWKMTFDGRRPSMEENLRWKTTFDRRRPSMEDDLRWKTTFDGRRPSVEDDLRGQRRETTLNHMAHSYSTVLVHVKMGNALGVRLLTFVSLSNGHGHGSVMRLTTDYTRLGLQFQTPASYL